MGTLLSNVLREVRYAVRALRKTPAFTVGALVTVALTVGATTAIFSVVYGVLLRQLPYRDADEVYWIWSDQAGRDRTPFNVPDFVDYRDSTRMLSGLAGFFAYSANLSDEAAAERVQGLRATGNFFDVLGVPARIGRVLQPGDERPDAGPVVVLGESFWMRRFGGDRSIVGRTIRLNGEAHTVVGVMPSNLATPVLGVELVVPFAPDRDPRRGARNSLNFIQGVGRLAEQVSLAQATSELNGIARRLQEQFPVENGRKRGVRTLGALDGIVGPFRTALLTLLAAVGAVLLIACANVANLMLARAAGRRKELAVQLALGAPRGTVVRQVLVEAVLVSLGGGLLGVLVARVGVVALVALAPTQLPRAGEIRIDLAVLVFSLVVSSLVGVLFGVIPALTSARVDVRAALQGSSRGATGGGQRIRGALVSAEVAIAVVLLVAMTLLAKSFANVQGVAPGFDATQVLSARLTLPAKRFGNRDAIVAFQRALGQQLSSLSTVTHAGAISSLPLSGVTSRVPFTVEGRALERERVPVAQYRTVSSGYFEAARIPVLRGRTFDQRDTDRTRAVAIVNDALARRWLDGLEPVGSRLLVDDNNTGPRPFEVIGVVGNVRQATLDGDQTWDLYLPYPQLHDDNVGLAAANMFWIVRTADDPMALAGRLAREVHRVDPEVAASQIRPMDHYLSDAMAPRRFSLSLMAAFAIAALALATTGIAAVVTYAVSQRTHEIAIRLALGASRSSVVRLVIGQGIRFTIAGIAVGLVAATGATRLLSTMLVGVTATDATTFGHVALVVAAVSVLACAVPTVRVTRMGTGLPRAE
jgi:putative ABC transport system permease protein